MSREQKFRQAAMVYLLVGILYEASVYVQWRRGLLVHTPGPPLLWLLIGAVVVAIVFWGLWKWRNVWFARVIFVVHAVRIPFLIEQAFLPTPEQRFSPAFFQTALIVVIINLWMLARAGWDV